MTTEPTDAEIVALMRDGYNCRYNDEADHIDFARAVLARWGQPAGREPLTGEQIQDAAPKYYVEDFLDFNAGVRFAEQHHGIKGGQHGESV